MLRVGFDTLRRKKFLERPETMRPLTIIVPVFNGAAAVERCLDGLGRCRPAHARIILHDDASTDPAIAPLLASFASSIPAVRVMAAEANGGFIRSCNGAAAASPSDSDLLFLNSDTELTAGAVEEMLAVLEATGAAACCPMSNNATFLSVPRYQQANELPDGWSAEDMALLLRQAAGDGRAIAIPTPVGFCMLVRRAAWDAWGPFDAAYGSGYGEEDEFGQRVQASGGLIVAAMRAYVWHRGGESFGPSEATRERRRANGELLVSRWPDYPVRMHSFCRANPFRPMLERLWDALLSAPERRTRHVLHLVPRWERDGPLRDRVLGLARATRDVANHTIVVPTPDRGAWLDAIDFEIEAGTRVTGLIDLPTRFGRFLAASPATHVHLHHAAQWQTDSIQADVRNAGRPLLVSVGDEPAIEACGRWYR